MSAHFGAISLPNPDQVWEGGMFFDRFTDLTKVEDVAAAAADWRLSNTKTRHYALRASFGTQAAYMSRAWRWRGPAVIMRLGAFGGWLTNQPSSFLQNEFRHTDLGVAHIDVDEKLSGRMYGAIASIDRWVDVMPDNKHLKMAAYVGLAGQYSNLYDEASLKLGIRTTYIDAWGWKHTPQFAVGLSKGLIVRPRELLTRAPRDTGLASPRDLIANTFSATTMVARFPLHVWFRNRTLVPDLVYGHTFHSGLFSARRQLDSTTADTAFRRLSEEFFSLALLWGNGDVTLETYNDAPGGKDIGPSFGLRLYMRFRP